MRIAGHSSIVISQRYVHPSKEFLDQAFERLESLNLTKTGAIVENLAGTQKEPQAPKPVLDTIPQPPMVLTDGRVAQLAEQVTLKKNDDID
jgi:hypothetical protein